MILKNMKIFEEKSVTVLFQTKNLFKLVVYNQKQSLNTKFDIKIVCVILMFFYPSFLDFVVKYYKYSHITTDILNTEY